MIPSNVKGLLNSDSIIKINTLINNFKNDDTNYEEKYVLNLEKIAHEIMLNSIQYTILECFQVAEFVLEYNGL